MSPELELELKLLELELDLELKLLELDLQAMNISIRVGTFLPMAVFTAEITGKNRPGRNKFLPLKWKKLEETQKMTLTCLNSF